MHLVIRAALRRAAVDDHFVARLPRGVRRLQGSSRGRACRSRFTSLVAPLYCRLANAATGTFAGPVICVPFSGRCFWGAVFGAPLLGRYFREAFWKRFSHWFGNSLRYGIRPGLFRQYAAPIAYSAPEGDRCNELAPRPSPDAA
jgi:hypothetical protein